MSNHRKIFAKSILAYLILTATQLYSYETKTLIKVNDNNNAAMIWTVFNKTWCVMGTSSANNQWNVPQIISNVNYPSGDPRLEMSSKGNWVAIWTTYRTDLGITCLYGSMVTPGQAWAPAIQLSLNTEKVIEGSHSVCINGPGIATATWQSEMQGSIVTRMASTLTGSVWTKPVNGP